METKTKSFWERPEGNTGIIIGALLLTAAACGLYFALPFLITLMTNVLALAGLCAAAALLVFLVADKRMRTLVSYGYKSIMRKLTGLFVEIDPVGIMKNYVSTLQERLEKMKESIANLRGQKDKLKNLIDQNEATMKHSLDLANMARKKGGADMKPQFILQARKAGRIEKSNVTLKSLHTTMESLHVRLNRMKEVSEFLVEDITDEVANKERERNAIRAGYGAFSAAKSILAGNGEDREMYDMATESLANDYAQKLGEIEQFMDDSDGFIKGVDLENMAFESDAMDTLAKWDTRIDALLDQPTDKKNRVTSEAMPRLDPIVGKVRVTNTDDEELVETIGKRESYADLFGPSSKK